MHSFYRLPIFFQWFIAIILTSLTFAIVGTWVELSNRNALYFLLFFLLLPVLQFLSTPILSLSGVYRYVSPMLLIYLPNKERYDLHNGTSFDYLFVNRKLKSGRQLRNRMLYYYVQGFLNIIKEFEEGKVEEKLVIRGSSYFFSETTAIRFGFEVSNINSFEKLNLYVNYIDLLWMYSVSKGKLCFPRISESKTVSTTVGKLRLQKIKLEQLTARLEKGGLDSNNPI